MLGSFEIAYALIVATFGEPNSVGDPDKVDAEWIIDTPYGSVDIYNYKNGYNYAKSGLGDYEEPEESDYIKTEDITDWHIDGADRYKKEINDWLSDRFMETIEANQEFKLTPEGVTHEHTS